MGWEAVDSRPRRGTATPSRPAALCAERNGLGPPGLHVVKGNVGEEDQTIADTALLSALRRHIETDRNRLSGPGGESVDETEVEGLAVLVAAWRDKADDPDPTVQKERGMIRTRIDGFADVAKAAGLI